MKRPEHINRYASTSGVNEMFMQLRDCNPFILYRQAVNHSDLTLAVFNLEHPVGFLANAIIFAKGRRFHLQIGLCTTDVQHRGI